jgi:Mg2+-importing ATPase
MAFGLEPVPSRGSSPSLGHVRMTLGINFVGPASSALARTPKPALFCHDVQQSRPRIVDILANMVCVIYLMSRFRVPGRFEVASTRADDTPQSFWNVRPDELLRSLGTTVKGLASDEADRRLGTYGSNVLRPKRRTDALTLLLHQFKSPIIIILLVAAATSFFLADQADAIIILLIVLISGLLGFWQEKGAANAIARLLEMVQISALVLRDGAPKPIPIEDVVPGDVVSLSAGDSIPGDCLILESKDLFVDEAALTGETYPVEKVEGIVDAEASISARTNALFMGTHVVSGTGISVVVRTGKSTEFGKVSERLRLRPPETEFERGVRRFGFFLMQITLVLVIAIFAINVYLNRPVLDSFLFSLALAVGLTPQLLPAIISINLAHGAKKMAQSKVIVKRLESIENFGSMNMLCSDKTGTLTQGVVQVHSAVGIKGLENEKVLMYAYLNSRFQSGFTNPIDEAIVRHAHFDDAKAAKLDEVPYDFVRKRLSVLIEMDGKHLMITKGAYQSVMNVCSRVEDADGVVMGLEAARLGVQQRFVDLSRKGFRILGVAKKDLGEETKITKDSEQDMIFLGFLVLYDPTKPGLSDTISELQNLGVSLKVITGDNHMVATSVMQEVGVRDPKIVTGPELLHMSDEALLERVRTIDVFAEVEPNQKERIIVALKKAGNVVGYIGDGINDASALHAADVGISVDSAVDVAKDAADIVLLEKDLGVLLQGVREGRSTFANTLKYVFMATSANFGNMFSMAGASLFLTFLPLLPKQVLLTNLMTDFPETTIANDSVDPELVVRPRRWDIKFIRRFMLVFGLISSVFDFVTFAVLLFVLGTTTNQFRTGWFLESVVSASVIVLVIRTRRPFFKSRPGNYLVLATVAVIATTLALPFVLPVGLFDFSPLPTTFLLVMGLIVMLYVVAAEVAKRMFYQISQNV